MAQPGGSLQDVLGGSSLRPHQAKRYQASPFPAFPSLVQSITGIPEQPGARVVAGRLETARADAGDLRQLRPRGTRKRVPEWYSQGASSSSTSSSSSSTSSSWGYTSHQGGVSSSSVSLPQCPSGSGPARVPRSPTPPHSSPRPASLWASSANPFFRSASESASGVFTRWGDLEGLKAAICPLLCHSYCVCLALCHCLSCATWVLYLPSTVPLRDCLRRLNERASSSEQLLSVSSAVTTCATCVTVCSTYEDVLLIPTVSPCLSSAVSLCHCVTVSLCHCVTVSLCHCVYASLCHCVTASLCHCVTVSLCHCVTASLCHCVTASLCHCVTVSLCHCVTVSLCHCVTVSLCHCVTVSLCHCVTVSLCHCVTVSLCHCVTVSLCHCVTASLCHCVTASLCCVTVSLCHCVTVSLCHCVTVSLCHCVTVSLCHCAACPRTCRTSRATSTRRRRECPRIAHWRTSRPSSGPASSSCPSRFTIFLPIIAIAPQKFALCFTVGSSLAMGAFFALKGPAAQLESMLAADVSGLDFLGCLNPYSAQILTVLEPLSVLEFLECCILEVLKLFSPSARIRCVLRLPAAVCL